MKVAIVAATLLSLGSALPDAHSHAHAASKLSDELRSVVQRHHEKRVLFDPLTAPIEGEPFSCAFILMDYRISILFALYLV